MNRWTRLIPALAVSLVLGACSQGGGDNPLAPEGPRMDTGTGGWGVGGTITGDPENGGASTTSASEGEGETGTIIPPDSTNRGGGWGVGGT